MAPPPSRLALLALPALLAAAFAAPADGHGAGAPADPFTRLLADQNDDCGAESAHDCRNTPDLIALDVQEAHDAGSGGDLLVFRFWMDKPKAPAAATVTLTLTAAGAAKSLSLKTGDGSSFSGDGGFERVEAAKATGDGTRFTVDGAVSFAGLGVQAGTKLAGFKVEARAGPSRGDYMPGGCESTIGGCDLVPGQDTTSYTRPDYTLRGPTYYATLSGPSGTQQVPLGGDGPVLELQVTNALRSTAQEFTLTLSGLSGASGGFHGGAHAEDMPYAPSVTFTLEGRARSAVHLLLHGEQEGAGTATVTLTSSLGGRNELQVPYTVAAAATTPTDGTSHATTDATSSSKGSPAATAAPLMALALLALALRRRS